MGRLPVALDKIPMVDYRSSKGQSCHLHSGQPYSGAKPVKRNIYISVEMHVVEYTKSNQLTKILQLL